ncbi:MAG: hypothetical protein AB7U82_23125 [Blastocatellales bacterium]
MKNTQLVVSSRIFPAFAEKISVAPMCAVARASLERLKHTGIECLCGLSHQEKTL